MPPRARGLVKRLAFTLASAAGPSARRAFKEFCEIRFWRSVVAPIAHDPTRMLRERGHYEYFFTEYFGLTREDYRDMRILDIGCGPMGSLEWADLARERIGLDPLADRYRGLVGGRHAMTYVAAPSEAIPYPDGHFDVVTTFNSLDHVDDIDHTIAEMKRVLAATGRLLLIVEIDHPDFDRAAIPGSDDHRPLRPGVDGRARRNLRRPP